jgi:hypothetical protein
LRGLLGVPKWIKKKKRPPSGNRAVTCMTIGAGNCPARMILNLFYTQLLLYNVPSESSLLLTIIDLESTYF